MSKHWADCTSCGHPVRRNWKAGQPKLCVPCGVGRGDDAALQMAAKAGPHYDAWLASRGPAGRPSGSRA